jgi:hypothetical protein
VYTAAWQHSDRHPSRILSKVSAINEYVVPMLFIVRTASASGLVGPLGMTTAFQ